MRLARKSGRMGQGHHHSKRLAHCFLLNNNCSVMNFIRISKAAKCRPAVLCSLGEPGAYEQHPVSLVWEKEGYILKPGLHLEITVFIGNYCRGLRGFRRSHCWSLCSQSVVAAVLLHCWNGVGILANVRPQSSCLASYMATKNIEAAQQVSEGARISNFDTCTAAQEIRMEETSKVTVGTPKTHLLYCG